MEIRLYWSFNLYLETRFFSQCYWRSRLLVCFLNHWLIYIANRDKLKKLIQQLFCTPRNKLDHIYTCDSKFRIFRTFIRLHLKSINHVTGRAITFTTSLFLEISTAADTLELSLTPPPASLLACLWTRSPWSPRLVEEIVQKVFFFSVGLGRAYDLIGHFLAGSIFLITLSFFFDARLSTHIRELAQPLATLDTMFVALWPGWPRIVVIAE